MSIDLDGRSSRRLVLLAALSMIAAATALALPATTASASYGRPDTPQPNPAVAVPLAGSISGTITTWATVDMGKNSGDFDLFWQLLSIDSETGRVALVTPPGVADNGGLMVAPDANGTDALVGIGASQGLKFSPLALTTDGGRNWSQGGLPDALDPAPSVVGFDGSGTALALVGNTKQAVLERSGGLTSWRTLVASTTLAATPAGRTCTIGSFEAVALGEGAIPLIGASCREPDVPGVFVDSDAEWHLADIPVPATLADDVFAVLRLQSNSALLAAVHRNTTSIVTAWEEHRNRPWVLSTPLPLGDTSNLLASGTGPGTSQFVLIRAGGTVRAEIVNGPNASWRALPALPKSTATIAFAPSGRIDALSINVTVLSVWRLTSNGQRWTKVQSIKVPIAFGSSS